MKTPTFASMAKSMKVKHADEKLVTVNADRNLFARLLIASKTREINLKEILKYELAAVPYALAHTDGSLRKSVLMSTLEEKVDVSPVLPVQENEHGTESSTAYVVDGMAVIQMTKAAGARTFGELADSYFKVITAPLDKPTCSRIDIVFDRYDHPYIKDTERQRRGSTTSYEVHIASPNTPVPKQWSRCISNPVNKVNLQRFLSDMWRQMGKTRLKAGKQLVLAECLKDPQDVCPVARGSDFTLEHLRSDHEEADTRILLHVKDCARGYSRVVINSPDTDVFVCINLCPF